MNYKVSVIVPVYNCEKHLNNAVDSVISQPDFSELQLILVDDGSSDNSGLICDEYKKYENVFVIHQKNTGVSAARNAGLKIAQGEWIAFLDSDDRLVEGVYKKMLEYAKADIICCEYSSNIGREYPLNKYFTKSFIEKDEFADSVYKCMFSGSCLFQCWNKLYKKSIIDEYKLLFPVNVKIAEDMVFVFNYIKHIKNFAFTDEPLYYYYVNRNNTTSYVEHAFEVNKFIYYWQKDNYSDFPDDNNKNYKYISENFVYRNVVAISSAANRLPLLKGFREVKKILHNKLFFDAYLDENYTEFVCTYDKYLNRFIRQQKAVKIIIWTKLFKLRSFVKG